jgi:hypothetical protein
MELGNYFGFMVLAVFFGGIWLLNKTYVFFDSIKTMWQVDIQHAVRELDQVKLDQGKTDGKLANLMTNLIKLPKKR